MSSIYPAITLKSGRERSIESRHPWIFSGAIDSPHKDVPAGSVVDVRTAQGEFAARGFFNPSSEIAVRILSFAQEEINASFFSGRIADALSLRLTYYREALEDPEGALRLIYAESDGLPGFIVDRYAHTLAVQFLSAGMKKQEGVLLPILCRQFSPRTIYDKSEASAKEEEGVTHTSGVVFGEPLPELLAIREDGMTFYVDVAKGQKTGFYLDLREVRRFVRTRSAEKTVLNIGCYTGSLSLAALAGGAKHVSSVDSSENHLRILEKSLELGRYNAARHQSIEGDMFQFLRHGKGNFDLIILDPPAFAQRKKDVGKAIKGYKELHLSALKRLNKGGELVTLCCSHHIDETLFAQIIFYALKDLKLTAHIIRRFTQPADHPVSPFFPEGAYFKGLVIRKV